MKALYIPEGPKNLAPLFPTINFTDIEEYWIELKADETVIGSSAPVQLTFSHEHVRIHYLNNLGTIDAVNFKPATVEVETKSERFERPLTYPLDKTAHSVGRTSVSSTEVRTAKTIQYNESEFEWLKELFESSLAWIEQESIQGQPVTYLPIVIMDQKFITRKEEERYVYETEIQYTLSNNTITIRN